MKIRPFGPQKHKAEAYAEREKGGSAEASAEPINKITQIPK
jgi:hypothetical protein